MRHDRPLRGGPRPARAKSRSKAPAVTYDTVRKFGLALPGVEEATSYGTPALKVRGKFLLRLKEDGETIAIRVDYDTREALMQAEPATYYITDHYLAYPAMLVRLTKVRPEALRQLIDVAWRFSAPKALLAQRRAD